MLNTIQSVKGFLFQIVLLKSILKMLLSENSHLQVRGGAFRDVKVFCYRLARLSAVDVKVVFIYFE